MGAICYSESIAREKLDLLQRARFAARLLFFEKAMIKKTKSTAGQPAGKKKNARKKRTKKKKVDPAKVREELSGMVKSEAKNITEAVMDHATQGELAAAKYLFELAGVYPPMTDREPDMEEEDCLARTLLNRLNVSRKLTRNDEQQGDADKTRKSEDSELNPSTDPTCDSSIT